jgi:hypothetical protein
MMDQIARARIKLGLIQSALEGRRFNEAETLLLELQLELARLTRDVQQAKAAPR